MSTVKATNFSHPSAANPAIVLDAAGGATVAGMGLVLVSPTSIANSGGSASASGGKINFTDVASVSLNGVFTSTYENYLIMVTEVVANSALALNFRLRSAGTDATGTNYTFQQLTANDTSVTGGRTGSQTSAQINTARTDSHGCDTTLNIFRPQLATETNYSSQVGFDGGNSGIVKMLVGNHSLTTAYDGITFLIAGTMTGAIRVYGYRNA